MVQAARVKAFIVVLVKPDGQPASCQTAGFVQCLKRRNLAGVRIAELDYKLVSPFDDPNEVGRKKHVGVGYPAAINLNHSESLWNSVRFSNRF
ncbi:hypothetical protein B0E33_28520 (plasmid) [Roseibium algicola]|uniref:Uncharacterized protein n=1 Tax=Roseibium algicola TaxID=2857014 RepID=A0ABM6IB75_9HYPH|nr:hypothetical protein B0E33_28520 [Roseibium aggregatum]